MNCMRYTCNKLILEVTIVWSLGREVEKDEMQCAVTCLHSLSSIILFPELFRFGIRIRSSIGWNTTPAENNKEKSEHHGHFHAASSSIEHPRQWTLWISLWFRGQLIPSETRIETLDNERTRGSKILNEKTKQSKRRGRGRGGGGGGNPIIFEMEIQIDQSQAWFRMVAYLIDRGRQA